MGLTSDRVYRWRLILQECGPEIVYIPGVTNVVANAMSRLEYDTNVNKRIINVHIWHKALARSLRRYVEATTEYKPFQTDEGYLPSDTITTHHGSHIEHRYNNMLVVEPDTQQPVRYDDTARQQAVLSRRYLIVNRTAEKEDAVYPVAVK